MKNILQMLEMSSKKYPNKIIFGDVKDEIKYAEFTKKAKIIRPHQKKEQKTY